jgi:glycosyltransferase involved in cell wall biosynthesis
VKILHTTYDDPWNPWLAGGGALRTHQISQRLASRHEITILTGRYPGAAESEERDGIRFVRVGSAQSYAVSRLSFGLAAATYLMQAEYDLWVYGFSAFAPIYSTRARRQNALLECFHLMGGHAVEKYPLVGRATPYIESTTLRAYANVLSISPSVRDNIADIRGAQGLHLVYTGVDDSCFVQPPVEEDYILYFGRHDIYMKGIDLLLQAFALVAATDVRLKLAGRGSDEDRQQLEQLATDLGIASRIELVGSVSDAQRRELYRRCLFVCTPSRYEGWCIAAVEAAAASKPVIGTDIPGLADAVRDGQTGHLVASGDVEALAQAMRRLLADPGERSRLGTAGRTWAERFTWEQIAQDQEEVYQAVVNRG